MLYIFSDHGGGIIIALPYESPNSNDHRSKHITSMGHLSFVVLSCVHVLIIMITS